MLGKLSPPASWSHCAVFPHWRAVEKRSIKLLLGALCLMPILVLAAPTISAAESILPLSYDSTSGKLILTLRELDQPMLYTTALASGLGSTLGKDPGMLMDRGEPGRSATVHFERHGARVLLVQRNSIHSALAGGAAAERAVAESFPSSVLAAMPITTEGDGVLQVDATAFFLQDVIGAAASLKISGFGNAKLDVERSRIDPAITRPFPENSEIRALLTFSVDEPSKELARRAPDARSVTVAQHHSFMALPDAGYRTRNYHPRSGAWPHVVLDFAQPLDSDYRRRWISRWRLEPADPTAYLAGQLSAPVKPIVYHLDPAIPEPYREAFREGVLWWNEAFEEAGFRDAIQVHDLPDGVDPLDARYNVIQWLHRAGPGPSVGGPSHVDPRTGEMVRGLVRMDSHRSLVNHDIYMGFLPAAGADGLAMSSEALAMARRRQHAAHEVGHSIGLLHNFIAAMDGRASVMDYPVPLVSLDATGKLDLSRAYASGIGAFDRQAIRYAYTWYPDEESERAGLAAILAESDRLELRFISDGEAGPLGGFPDAGLWVEGDTAFEAWERGLAVRQALVASFDERALMSGEPYSTLNRRFAHVYLHHRPALYGLIKFVGGFEQRYALAGEPARGVRVVPAEEQHRALALLQVALSPEVLRIPQRVVGLVAAEPPGWNADSDVGNPMQLLPMAGTQTIDSTAIAHALAQEIVALLLDRSRMSRTATFHQQDPAQPGLEAVFDSLMEASWRRTSSDITDAAILRAVQRAVLDGLLDLAGDAQATTEARSGAHGALEALATTLRNQGKRVAKADGAHRSRALRDIDRFLDGRDTPALRPRPATLVLPWP